MVQRLRLFARHAPLQRGVPIRHLQLLDSGKSGESPPVICGDHRRGGSEVCDGPDVGGKSCIGLGFDGGYLMCNATCDALDLSTCSECGDNLRTLNERCDGTDMGGETCQTLGFASGTLKCTADCTGLDKTDCH